MGQNESRSAVENGSGTFDVGGTHTVHRLGFGAMCLCGDDIIGEPDDPESSREVLREAVDLGVDFEASVRALAELKDDGGVEHVGLSNVSVDQLAVARDHVEVATVQNEYSLVNREHEDVLEACEDADIGFIPYFPIGAGDVEEKADVVDDVAEAHDASRYQVALAWLLQHSDVTLPIPGTSSVDHLRENVAASQLSLSDDEVARLSE